MLVARSKPATTELNTAARRNCSTPEPNRPLFRHAADRQASPRQRTTPIGTGPRVGAIIRLTAAYRGASAARCRRPGARTITSRCSSARHAAYLGRRSPVPVRPKPGDAVRDSHSGQAPGGKQTPPGSHRGSDTAGGARGDTRTVRVGAPTADLSGAIGRSWTVGGRQGHPSVNRPQRRAGPAGDGGVCPGSTGPWRLGGTVGGQRISPS